MKSRGNLVNAVALCLMAATCAAIVHFAGWLPAVASCAVALVALSVLDGNPD